MWIPLAIAAGVWGVASIVDSVTDDNDTSTVSLGLTPATVAALAVAGVVIWKGRRLLR